MKVIDSDPNASGWLEIENNAGQRQRYVRGDGMEGPQAAHVVGLPKSPTCTRQLPENEFPEEIIGEVHPFLPADLGTAVAAHSAAYYRYRKQRSSSPRPT